MSDLADRVASILPGNTFMNCFYTEHLPDDTWQASLMVDRWGKATGVTETEALGELVRATIVEGFQATPDGEGWLARLTIPPEATAIAKGQSATEALGELVSSLRDKRYRLQRIPAPEPRYRLQLEVMQTVFDRW